MNSPSHIPSEKTPIDYSQMEEFTMLVEEALQFLPQTPKLRPLEDFIDLPFLSLDDVDLQPFDIEGCKPKRKCSDQVKVKPARKRTSKRHRMRKDSETGVLD